MSAVIQPPYDPTILDRHHRRRQPRMVPPEVMRVAIKAVGEKRAEWCDGCNRMVLGTAEENAAHIRGCR